MIDHRCSWPWATGGSSSKPERQELLILKSKPRDVAVDATSQTQWLMGEASLGSV